VSCASKLCLSPCKKSVKMNWGKKLPTDRRSIGFYKHSNNDQRDDLVFPFIQHLLRYGLASDEADVFSLFPKSVCFHDSANKWSWNGVRQPGCADLMVHSCVCVETFHRVARNKQWAPHVALVEGVIGRLPSAPHVAASGCLGPQRSEWEFHSVVVIVDPFLRAVFVFNPWRQGTRRSPSVTRTNDLRPNLVRKMVRMFTGGYDYFYKSGTQVGTSDCRVHCLKFLRALGKMGRDNYPYDMGWTKLKKK
jgi:hypothetical protein